jgi:hypothetical protein
LLRHAYRFLSLAQALIPVTTTVPRIAATFV